MSIDGNLIHHLIIEWQNQLQTGRIRKIYQLSRFDLLFHIHKNNKKHLFLISSSPRYARIYISQKNYVPPKNPPAFGMFLRKHLEGGIIKNIYQIKNDRIIFFQIEKRNEMGDLSTKNLIVELMGKYSNIILTDENLLILDAIKRNVGFEKNVRTIYPKSKYTLPKTNKISPQNIPALRKTLQNLHDVSDKTLLNILMGFSPLATKEIYYRYTKKEDLLTSITGVYNDKNPVLIKADKDYFYHTDLTHLQGKRTHYNSVNTLLDDFYKNREQLDQKAQFAKDLKVLIKNKINRNINKIEKLTLELKNTEKMDIYLLEGELIKANLHNLSKGQSILETINYNNNEKITIKLDPFLSPIKNAEQKFKKYRKLKQSIPHIKQQIELAKNELEYFIELETQLDFATYDDIIEIREELINKKLVFGKHHKKRNKKPNIDVFTSPDGYQILLGKNNIQNDYITHSLAKPTDIWLHAKNIPGSHVIIKGTFPISEETLRFAAKLAACFSKARYSTSVPVDYTLKKYVKKIPGKMGSFVRYKNQKTIYIDPEECD